MSSSGTVAVEDALYQQARSVQGKDFEDLIDRLRGILLSSDRGPNCLTLLRQLYVLTAASKYNRNISSDIIGLLKSVVLEPEQGSARVRLISSAILRELTPSKYIELNDFGPPVELLNVPYFLPVLLAQTNTRDRLSKLSPIIVRWLTQPGHGHDEELSLSSLTCLHGLCSHGRALERVGEEELRTVSTQLAQILKAASKVTVLAPTSGISLFGSASKKQLVPVKEIDGTTSQDIFTVLNFGGEYSSDQILNITAFSLLRRWLLTTLSSGAMTAPSPSPAPTPTMQQDHYRGQGISSPGPDRYSSSRTTPSVNRFPTSLPSPLSSALLQALSLTGGTITPGGVAGLTSSLITSIDGRSRQGLKEVAVQYCLRIIDQSERKPLKSPDEELVTACLLESISIVDILCSLSRSLVHVVLPVMRKLYSRFAQAPVVNARLLLPLVKFFINHGDSEMYDSETPISVFFGQVLSAKFNDSSLAYDVIDYLVSETEHLHSATTIFTKCFPNILKILAWSPITFIGEFLQLLPAFITKSSASEVLHSLLDLPCLSATLQAHYLTSNIPNITDTNALPQYTKCLAAYQDATYKLMFGHFLRGENGKGDTIDRLGSLHLLLEDFSGHQRIIATAQVAPMLIKLFFKTVFYGEDVVVIRQLISVILERIVLLYKVGSYQDEVRKVLAEQLLMIFKLHPLLVIDFHRDILDFISNLRTLTSGGEHCYMHLVWILGEYSHTGYDSRCTTSLLVEYFEVLEGVAYEVSLNLHRQRNYTTRLVLILMSTVAKIASRCQDLIPRALLCLNKIVQLGHDTTGDAETHKILLRRANELVNVLKVPSIASAVLSPPAHSGGGLEMQRQTGLAYLLQSTANYLQT